MNEDRHPFLWGDPADAVDAGEIDGLAELLSAQFPDADLAYQPPLDWRDVALPAPRIGAPAALSAIVSDAPHTRLLHAAGRSFSDLVRLRAGDVVAPDVVAQPRDEAEVAAVLDWCADVSATCIPFGGGTSVVGGVNPPGDDRPVVTLQLRAMDRVLDVDVASRAAHIQAGASGPGLEEQLRGHDLTLRFFPQSFEYSTLGGWIATRAGGHYATRLTHIDDLVESVRAVTPTGLWESRRLPGSGAGPSPDRMLLGSEGILGVITEAWVRVQDRPRHRAAAAVLFPTFEMACAGVRSVVQSGLAPAGCRVLDPLEAALNGAGDGSAAVLLLSFESPAHPVDDLRDAAIVLCRDAGGVLEPTRERAAGAGGRWRRSFLRAPYLRDALIGLGLIVETFETAVTWNRLDTVITDTMAAVEDAVDAVCGTGIVTCRITHAYPDGAAPYFTVIAPGRRGSQVQQWAEIKAAASEALLVGGATITHHHAVGRDHRPWYDRQRPDPFAAALTAAKRTLDPAGILNPGVLIDP